MVCYFSIGPYVTNSISRQILLSSLYFIEKNAKLCCSKSINTLLSHCINILSYCHCLVLVVYLNTLAYSALGIHTFFTNVHMNIRYREIIYTLYIYIYVILFSTQQCQCNYMLCCLLVVKASLAEVHFKTFLESVQLPVCCMDWISRSMIVLLKQELGRFKMASCT